MAGTSGKSLRLEAIRIVLEDSDDYSVYRVEDNTRTLETGVDHVIAYHKSISTLSGNDCYYEIEFNNATNVKYERGDGVEFEVTGKKNASNKWVYEIRAKAFEEDNTSLETKLAPFGRGHIYFLVDGGQPSFDFYYKRLVPVPLGSQTLYYKEKQVRTWEEFTGYQNDGMVGVVSTAVGGVDGVASAVDVGSYQVFLELLYPERTQWMKRTGYTPTSGETPEQRHVNWAISQDTQTERAFDAILTPHDCQSLNGGDGSISGLTREGATVVEGIECSDNGQMEYLGPNKDPGTALSSEWIEFNEMEGNTLKNLRSGTYYVRYKSNKNYSKPSNNVEVIVGKYAPSGVLEISGLSGGYAVVGQLLKAELSEAAKTLVENKKVKFIWTISGDDSTGTSDENPIKIMPQHYGKKISVKVSVPSFLDNGGIWTYRNYIERSNKRRICFEK